MIPEFDNTKFHREYCALPTPYKRDSLEIDYDAFRKIIKYFTTDADFLKVKGALIAIPEFGEIFYLTPDERKKLVEILVEERPEGMPVFAGCFGVRRDEVIDSALQDKSLGVDGIFVLPPAGTMEVNLSLDGSRYPEVWTEHVRVIAEATGLPLILHGSCPDHPLWGGGLPGESVKMIMEQVPSVVAFKMLYFNVTGHFKAARLIRSNPRRVGILNVPFYAMHTALLCDLIDGSVMGVWNFNKESFIAHKLAWLRGDMKEVQRIWSTQILPLYNYVITEDPSRLHIRYKLSTWLRGHVPHPFMRPPMPPPYIQEAETLHKIITDAGISCIDKSQIKEVFSRKDKILKS